ncbi:MAG: nuclear transport factor 2 family protein [Deltaproteobacteria bacterium]|nr:nuclear transport factor 2 family protein [Deltaproteobacteria bacterium]
MTPAASRGLAIATLLAAPPVIYLLAAELTPPAAVPDPWKSPPPGAKPLPADDAPDAAAETVERLVRGYYDAINARNVDAVGEAWSSNPDTLAQHAGWPEARGRDAILGEYRREVATGTWEKLEPRDIRARVLGPRAEVAFVERVSFRTDGGVRTFRRVATQVWTAMPHGTFRLVMHRTLPTVLLPDGGGDP